MIRKDWGLGLVLAWLPTLLIGQVAQAVSLQLVPSSTNINVGQSVNVAVVISGLGNQSAPSLSLYDLDVSFNSSILAFNNSVVFGDPDPLVGNQLNLNGLGTGPLFALNVSGNSVRISEASGDSETDLDTQQKDSFTLATLSFNGVAAGNSSLGLSVTELLNAQLDPLTANPITGTSITVNPAAQTTPEPSLNLGILGGLLLLASSLKNRQ